MIFLGKKRKFENLVEINQICISSIKQRKRPYKNLEIKNEIRLEIDNKIINEKKKKKNKIDSPKRNSQKKINKNTMKSKQENQTRNTSKKVIKPQNQVRKKWSSSYDEIQADLEA